MSDLEQSCLGYAIGGSVTFAAISIIILWMMFC
jgi:hypothetical protein